MDQHNMDPDKSSSNQWKHKLCCAGDVHGVSNVVRMLIVQGKCKAFALTAHANLRLAPLPSSHLQFAFDISQLSFDQPTTNLASRRHVCQRPEQDRAQQPLEAEPFRDRDQHRQRKYPTINWHATARLTLRRR